MSIFRLLAETGAVLRVLPSSTTLGAIAMSPLLFHNFFEIGHKALPAIPSAARQSAWRRDKILWKGITFVHYLKDSLCPFRPSDKQRYFTNNSHKLALLDSHDLTYGKNGHSYEHEFLGLAGLSDGFHDVHRARTQVEVGDSQESLALLMANLILTMGTSRLHSFLKDMVDSPIDGSLRDLLQHTKLQLSEQELGIFHLMSEATVANSKKHTAWLWGTILPSITSRAAAEAAGKGYTCVPLYKSAAILDVTLKFDHKLAHNSYSVSLFVDGGQNDWAVFETTAAPSKRGNNNRMDYQTGIYAGDVLTFEVQLKSYGAFTSPLPDFTTCQAFVIRKSLRRREPSSQADVQKMQLAFKFPEKLLLEQWQNGSGKDYITQYQAVVKNISKLTKLPTPNAWALLTKLPEPQLALLSQKTVSKDAHDWPSPHRPKTEIAALCFKELEKQLLEQSSRKEELLSFVNDNRCRSVDEILRKDVLKHAFDFFGKLAGTDAQNMPFQADAHGPRQDRAQLLQLARTHPWICLAYYSPLLYLEFLMLLLSEDETFKLLIAHISANAHHGAFATHVQGIAGAGKTFQVMAIMTACHYLADINTLWVTKLNNPLYTAALAAQRYLPGEKIMEADQIMRVLASSHDDHTTPIDVQRTTKGHKWPASGLVILTSGLAATYIDFNPRVGEFFSNCDYVVYDEAQQFGAEDEAILFTTLPPSCVFIFVGDPEQPIGSASTAFAQLVIQKIAASCPGLRSTNITFKTGKDYVQRYLGFFGKAPAEECYELNKPTLLQQLLSPLFDNITNAWSNFHKIGWGGIGGLVIPYCVRCHDLNTLLWALPTYHSLFKGPAAQVDTCGYLSPVNSHDDEERLLLQPLLYNGSFYRGNTSWEEHENSRQSAVTDPVPQLTCDDVLPLATSIARKRFERSSKLTTQVFPTCLFDWNDPKARSNSSDNTWLRSVECIVNTTVAFILMTAEFSESETRLSKIGIFTPWLKVTKHLVSYYSLSQWLDHKNKNENPWDYFEEEFGQRWKDLPIEEIAQHIHEHPYKVRSILRIQTSITSASTTVTHALVIIPRHTRFTSNWAQGLVCLSRAQGTNFIFCPPRPPAGFFRYILPILHRKQDTPKLASISTTEVLNALTVASTLGGRSSLHCFRNQHFYTPLIFFDWPIAIKLEVKQTVGGSSQKSTLHEHLLLAQIPIQLQGTTAPTLEWRMAPTSEQNKADPDHKLSQIFLTFTRSRNSPDNEPTLRLWLAGTAQGQRKRLLLAFASQYFHQQL